MCNVVYFGYYALSVKTGPKCSQSKQKYLREWSECSWLQYNKVVIEESSLWLQEP